MEMVNHYKRTDHTDQLFGRLTVIVLKDSNKWGERIWTCRCSCGNLVDVSGSSLREGKTKSCGCLRQEETSKRLLTHGESATTGYTTEYKIWSGMKQRCLNPKQTKYTSYGGRGIKICQEWSTSFETFLKDVGRRPSIHHSLDRIDVNGNYEPNNVRWATHAEQQANKRKVCVMQERINELETLCRRYEERFDCLEAICKTGSEIQMPSLQSLGAGADREGVLGVSDCF